MSIFRKDISEHYEICKISGNPKEISKYFHKKCKPKLDDIKLEDDILELFKKGKEIFIIKKITNYKNLFGNFKKNEKFAEIYIRTPYLISDNQKDYLKKLGYTNFWFHGEVHDEDVNIFCFHDRYSAEFAANELNRNLKFYSKEMSIESENMNNFIAPKN